MRIKLILLIIALWVTACVPAQEPTSEPATVPLDTAVTSPPVVEPSTGEPASPYAPQPGDSSLTRGNVFIEEMGLITRESHPPQISLGELTLDKIPQVLIFNKCDRLPAAQAEALCRRYDAIGICALDASTLRPLIDHLATRVNAMTSAREPDVPPLPASDTALASPN